MTGIIQVFVNGLLIGGVYALIAVSLTMIFGVMKIINFAQSEYLMLGMYLTYSLSQLLRNTAFSNPYLLVIPIASVLYLIGIFTFYGFIKPILGRDSISYVLLTVGLSYVLQNVAQMIWTADPRSLPNSNRASSLYIEQMDISIPIAKLIAFALALVFVFVVFYFLQKTDAGRAMRATSENAQIAELLGINTRKSFIVAFGMGAMFAGIAGVLLSPIYNTYPRIGTLFSTTVFAIVILGGLGNVTGALLGGLLVGVVENYVGTYIALDLAPVAVFILFIVVMLFKPNGLFGKGARKA